MKPLIFSVTLLTSPNQSNFEAGHQGIPSLLEAMGQTHSIYYQMWGVIKGKERD